MQSLAQKFTQMNEPLIQRTTMTQPLRCRKTKKRKKEYK
uniref:Uncharacterized protein n=1 Tax=Rhizophora mucronata TaxID=61149 RepID=A0A2P2NK66_RHIMU